MPQPLEFAGEWEVGLAEITYPRRWYNVQYDTKFAYMTHDRSDDSDQDHSLITKKIKRGYYASPNDLLRQMFKDEDLLGKVEYEYSTVSQKVTLKVLETGGLLRLGEDIGKLLGYDMPYGNQNFAEGIFEAENIADIEPVHHLFVYTNIVEDQIVGNVKVPLLRIVRVMGKYGSVQSLDYTNIHYVPLKQKFVDTIEVSLRDDTGNKIRFTRGRVIIKVHFRRRKSPYFH